MPTLTGPSTVDLRTRASRRSRTKSKGVDPHREVREEAIRIAMEYIELNYAFDIQLVDVAKRVPYSFWHFQRSFKRSVGKTVGQYIRACRMKQAKLLLTKTDMTVAGICMAVGYSSAGTFSTVFKMLEGYSPSDYRDLTRGTASE